jgi:hypothetical protein
MDMLPSSPLLLPLLLLLLLLPANLRAWRRPAVMLPLYTTPSQLNPPTATPCDATPRAAAYCAAAAVLNPVVADWLPKMVVQSWPDVTPQELFTCSGITRVPVSVTSNDAVLGGGGAADDIDPAPSWLRVLLRLPCVAVMKLLRCVLTHCTARGAAAHNKINTSVRHVRPLNMIDA